ncbi:MAG TPA: FxsA family protein [Solirubrobacteraceae bacterium]|nr:FxsA family protein [Solirubrobacteraceae bacterium]
MLVALLLLIVWPVAEVFVAIQIAEAIGVLWMLLLLIVSWPLGIWALRSRGRAAWRRLGEAAARGRPPGREVLDGALILLGGILLIVPGFITDAIGVFLLLPPTRALMRRALVRNFQSRLVVGAARFTRGSGTYDVDSTATDVDQPRLQP